MSNTKPNMTKKERIEQEELRIGSLHGAYESYAATIRSRVATGESIEIKPYESWIRKGTKTDETGKTIEIDNYGESGETPQMRFLRLGKARVTKALESLQLVLQLSGSAYKSTPEQQTRIVNALRFKVLDIENSFKAEKKEEEEFEL